MFPKVIKVDAHKTYEEINGIRLIYFDGRLIGWYNPNKDDEA